MKQEAELAAKWWGDKLSCGFSHDNGDAMQSALANFGKDSRVRPDANQIESFRRALAKLITEKTSGERKRLRISVDYHPNEDLWEAGKTAGIVNLELPIKTNMIIQPGSVEVSEGYGAKFIELMSKELISLSPQ